MSSTKLSLEWLKLTPDATPAALSGLTLSGDRIKKGQKTLTRIDLEGLDPERHEIKVLLHNLRHWDLSKYSLFENVQFAAAINGTGVENGLVDSLVVAVRKDTPGNITVFDDYGYCARIGFEDGTISSFSFTEEEVLPPSHEVNGVQLSPKGGFIEVPRCHYFGGKLLFDGKALRMPLSRAEELGTTTRLWIVKNPDGRHWTYDKFVPGGSTAILTMGAKSDCEADYFLASSGELTPGTLRAIDEDAGRFDLAFGMGSGFEGVSVTANVPA